LNFFAGLFAQIDKGSPASQNKPVTRVHMTYRTSHWKGSRGERTEKQNSNVLYAFNTYSFVFRILHGLHETAAELWLWYFTWQSQYWSNFKVYNNKRVDLAHSAQFNIYQTVCFATCIF